MYRGSHRHVKSLSLSLYGWASLISATTRSRCSILCLYIVERQSRCDFHRALCITCLSFQLRGAVYIYVDPNTGSSCLLHSEQDHMHGPFSISTHQVFTHLKSGKECQEVVQGVYIQPIVLSAQQLTKLKVANHPRYSFLDRRTAELSVNESWKVVRNGAWRIKEQIDQ